MIAAPRFAIFQVDAGIPRVALSRREAAEALGVSLDFFEKHIQAELRVIRRGSLRLIPVRELERWLEENAERVLGEAA